MTTEPDAPPKRARICIVRHNFYPFELNVKREAETLAREGYGVSVVCLRDKGEPGYESVNGVEVHRMPVGHKRGRIWRYLFEYNAFFLLASIRLIRLHIRNRFRVIQVNTMPDYLVFTALLPRLMGVKIVLHMHEPVPELFGTMFPMWYHSFFLALARLAEKWSLRFADRVITVTREMRDNFGRRGADINKITVVLNVPDDEMFQREHFRHLDEKIAALKREERRKGTYTILSHGAIEERYGFDVIVRAVAILQDKLPGIEFRFMGKGGDIESVLELARSLGVGRHVHYLGFLSFDDMVEEILAADAAVVPVKKNPYSVLVHTNKMYEYIALGKPVIASALESVQAYFPGDTLVYFDPDSPEDLANKIYHAYAHPEEVSRRVRSTSHIYESIRWEREKKKYLGVYRALLQEGRGTH